MLHRRAIDTANHRNSERELMFEKYFASAVCLLLVAITAGCDSKYPQVSGQVTVDGKPVANMSVHYTPVSTKENPFPGPLAKGKTDSEGRYSLTTRDGHSGGTPGLNIVEFYASGELEMGFMKSDLERLRAQAQGDKTDPHFKAAVELEQKVIALSALNEKGRLEPGAKTEFTVPDSGTDAADFELMELIEVKSSN